MVWFQDTRKRASCTDPNRFCEVTRVGAVLIHRFGRLGTSGSVRMTEHQNEKAAERELERRIRALVRKGYVPGRYNNELIAAISAECDTLGPYLVYGDWLQQAGVYSRRAHRFTGPARTEPRRRVAPGRRGRALRTRRVRLRRPPVAGPFPARVARGIRSLRVFRLPQARPVVRDRDGDRAPALPRPPLVPLHPGAGDRRTRSRVDHVATGP